MQISQIKFNVFPGAVTTTAATTTTSSTLTTTRSTLTTTRSPLTTTTTTGTTVGPTFNCPTAEGFYAIPNTCDADYYVCVSGSPYVSVISFLFILIR